MWKAAATFATTAAVGFALAGCRGVAPPSERQARDELKAVEDNYRAADRRPEWPALSERSSWADYLRFAMLNHPQIEAAYYDWRASVERITVARSMPDPRLTFQAYIESTLTSLMPGLMQEFPGPGKLKAAANVASAESEAKYYAFETAVLRTAAAVKQACYPLWFLDERIRINRETLGLLAQLEASARAQNETGRATLQDVYRAQIEQDQLATEITNLEYSRSSLMAQFKGSLGLTQDQADPPPPARFDSTPLDLSGDNLLATAFARNSRLKEMEAGVRLAEASLALARKSRVPDSSAGLQAEVYMPPFYWPQGSVSLPIWRDKIAAQIAAAQDDQRAAEARLTAEQITVTVDFARKSYDYSEVTRNLALLQDELLPKARASLEIARASYLAGQIDFLSLIDAQRALLNFQLQEVEARARRESILTDLSLSIAGIAPDGAPLLPHPRGVSSASTAASVNLAPSH
jgi:outer membrane protein, heavy metal efflux system